MNVTDDMEIDLFDIDNDGPDLVEEEWGQSWDVNDVTNIGVIENADGDRITRCDAELKQGEEVHSSCSSTPVERMALNDHKAGMTGLDKDKINKIIHEASKGSKYYENEKRKEENARQRIRAMLAELEKYNESDKRKALLESDKMVRELRKGIDLTRTIVHIDMDAFYAAVEIRDNPSLKDVPMAVGGNSMLSTSNYAARKFGVRAAMPGYIAKKLCPQLVIVPCHFEKYRSVSSDIREIFAEYDANYAPMSLDEAYLDLTEYIEVNVHKYDTTDIAGKDVVEVIVEEIRERIFKKTKLTASAGIAPNMMLSKICSDMNKPNGQYYLKPDLIAVKEFVRKLPIRKVFGIGKVSEQMLKSLGIMTCDDLYEKRSTLFLLFSETSFEHFMRVSQGISSNRIEHGKRKSMSVERTFSNVADKEELLKICRNICEQLAEDLAKENLQGCNVTLKYKLSSFVQKTRSKTLAYPIARAHELYSFSKELLINEIKAYEPEPFELRLMGVRVCHFVEKESKTQNRVEHFFRAQPGPSSGGAITGENEKTISKETCSDSETGKESATDQKVLCPVCGLEQNNDIVDLNAHIDKCLTKQTIKEIVKEQELTVKQERSSPNKTNKTSNKRKSQEHLGNADKKCTLYSFWRK